MHTLDTVLRRELENTICEARASAEAAARDLLEQLGVGAKASFLHLSEDEQDLRNKLRRYGNLVGDAQHDDAAQALNSLIEDIAYQHWHRMLFSRFLAENNLLMDDDPVSPVSLSLEDCNDRAISLGARSGWELAARYASHLLPQIFQGDSPAFLLDFPVANQCSQLKRGRDLSTPPN